LSVCINCTVLISGHTKRIAEAVTQEVRALVKTYGPDRIGFVTLTFPETVRSLVQAQADWHSLRTHVLSKRYVRSVCCVERHKSGGIHWHLVVVLPEPLLCRQTFSWEAWDKAKRFAASHGSKSAPARFFTWRYGQTACEVLRREWDFWKATAPKYGFGRVNTLPIRVNGDAISRYLAKYCTKGQEYRTEADHGARLVRFVGYLRKVEWVCQVSQSLVARRISLRTHTANFGWATVGGQTWRAKCEAYCRHLGKGDVQLGHLRARLIAGAKWGYTLRQDIVNQPLPLGLPPPVLARAAAWEHSHKVQTWHLAPVTVRGAGELHYVAKIEAPAPWVSPILEYWG